MKNLGLINLFIIVFASFIYSQSSKLPFIPSIHYIQSASNTIDNNTQSEKLIPNNIILKKKSNDLLDSVIVDKEGYPRWIYVYKYNPNGNIFFKSVDFMYF
jgi:hypothetical protein